MVGLVFPTGGEEIRTWELVPEVTGKLCFGVDDLILAEHKHYIDAIGEMRAKGYPIVLLTPPRLKHLAIELHMFEHPEEAAYVVGADFNEVNYVNMCDYLVYIPTLDEEQELYCVSAMSIALWDRIRKRSL